MLNRLVVITPPRHRETLGTFSSTGRDLLRLLRMFTRLLRSARNDYGRLIEFLAMTNTVSCSAKRSSSRDCFPLSDDFKPDRARNDCREFIACALSVIARGRSGPEAISDRHGLC